MEIAVGKVLAFTLPVDFWPKVRGASDTIREALLVHSSLLQFREAVACVVYVPVDVIKERLQVQGKDANDIRYKGGADALVKIWHSEGVHGIYRGYGATLMSFGPFSALYFVFYERFKSWSEDLTGSATLSLPWLIVSSASAGALASFLTSPLDMAKLRLQVERGRNQSTPSTVIPYRGIVDCLQQAYTRGGIRNGLFRGAGARVLHFVPATSKWVIAGVFLLCFFEFARLIRGVSVAISATSGDNDMLRKYERVFPDYTVRRIIFCLASTQLHSSISSFRTKASELQNLPNLDVLFSWCSYGHFAYSLLVGYHNPQRNAPTDC
jgi:hypothetical protein